MNTSNYEYLLTLEETGTRSETARRFYVSPSAISQCLKHAEAQLGYPIFYRENQRMFPTKEGNIFLRGARQILEIREKTYEKLNIVSQRHASIRIAVVPMLYDIITSDILTVLSNDFPDSDIELIRTDTRIGLAYLLNNLADLGILGIPMLENPLLSECILGEDFPRLLVPKAYLRGRISGTPTLADCSNLPFILLKKETHTRELQNQVLAESHFPKQNLRSQRSHHGTGFFKRRARGCISPHLSDLFGC
ncbi:MAG: LysR family transcriptional regulator [Lachnospiraceae bacterium]